MLILTSLASKGYNHNEIKKASKPSVFF